MRSGNTGNRSGAGRAGRPRRFRGTVLLPGILVALLCAALPAFSASVYLVAERPDHFLVYNKYQQTITPRERALLAPFVPMRIVRNNDVLGDGFTPCTTVEIGGELFYLVKGKDGELVGAERAGALKRFSDAVVLGDTITILTSGSYSIALPAGDARKSIRRGERLVRYFLEGDRTFVGTMDPSPIYGFVRLPASARRQSWEIARSAGELSAAIPQRVLTAIQQNLDEVNRVYQGLYSFFNRQTGQQRPIPHWVVSSSKGLIVCTLQNRPSGADLTQSTRYLVKDLENAVLGTALRVSGSPDHIEIRMEQVE